MKETFIKLHLSIIIAGGTGIFGKLITLNEGLLVWYRMMLATLILIALLYFTRKLARIPFKEMLKIGCVGLFLALHWLFFYGSIKASNVSIGVVCFSMVGFFTAFLEPLINRHRISLKEVLFSLLTLLGIVLIFHFDTRYRLGITLGIISSALAALFTVTNKEIGKSHTSSTLLLYEMAGGFIGISCILPFYLHYFPVTSMIPGMQDIILLFIFVSIFTIGLYLLQIQVLRTISAFTVNLSYNLEPVYSIIIAMIFFDEAKELNTAFYAGLGVIILSVILQTLSVTLPKRHFSLKYRLSKNRI